MKDANGDGDALDFGETRPFADGFGSPIDIALDLSRAVAIDDAAMFVDAGLLTLEWDAPAPCRFTVEHDEDLLPPWTRSTTAPTYLGNGRWRWQDQDWTQFVRRFYRITH